MQRVAEKVILSRSHYTYYYIFTLNSRKLLIMWGDYIASGLPDPGNQLCTDDFEGPSPHNVNLATKVYTR